MIVQPDIPKNQVMPAYADPFEHLYDVLKWLDLRIQMEVLKLRSRTQPFQQLAVDQQVYISHEEVDWLVGAASLPNSDSVELGKLRHQIAQLSQQMQARVVVSLEQEVFLPLIQLARTFKLSPFEAQAVVICLAPELHRKYDRLYAYLQDDITRKKPSVDLILTLLCSAQSDRASPDLSARWRAKFYFSETATLFRADILQPIDDPHSPSGASDLGRFLRLDGRILNYLLGNYQIDERLSNLVTLHNPSQTLEQVLIDPIAKTKMEQLLQHHCSPPTKEGDRVVVYLQGLTGVGKRELALGACAQLNCRLLYVDLNLLLAQEAEAEKLVRLVFREGLLLRGALYFDHLDRLMGDEPKGKMILKRLARIMADFGWLAFLAGEKPWHPQDLFESMVFQSIALSLPDMALRTAIWKQSLENHLPTADETWANQLANQFRLTPRQIRAAVAMAIAHGSLTAEQPDLTLADLYTACRNQSNQKLSELAAKVEPRYGWQDLILPEDKLAQLKEICSQSRHRYQVFGDWGFDRKLSHGKGLSALFSGPPGTGKTMAAQVIAHDLQVDLYKVDLAGVVSKYIGETEKNLSRIFQEAETSNAILFFDEADALFGKRTEVSDAHDRYANIETSYLLQRMEEYEGIVILATNLRANMDDAFTRRLRFIVEFPFPDDANRGLIWKTHFPPDAPLSEELDYEFLARKFQVAGGSIKNIVLSAAFFAAEEGGAICMNHVLRGAKREFEKIGKLWNEVNAPSSGTRKH
ncbi:ATP-binding protein (plasmid) [Phormidium sp. CLA17]|uniref:AAA family ATPase n=1 Tax=Leptolyngbya sp. Cla-17 TaxID=2803751 RepID=UPI001490B284|nr:AAA family ATPase [Leptolyngbya sp. Cla-17]MBM0745394.1 ATP-binding protein [Leptolyngbya sp. Cla-17]